MVARLQTGYFEVHFLLTVRNHWDVRGVSETLGANWTDVKGQFEQHRMHNLITIKTG
jgi:hypothetical protein